MKNENLKTNKTNLIPKLILVVILATTVSLSLASCILWSFSMNRTISFESHEELLEFVEEYNSKNDGFVYTFVSFDFDDCDNIETYEYTFSTISRFRRKLLNEDIVPLKLYDKDHSKGFGFGCKMIFYMNDVSLNEDPSNTYKITCLFGTKDDYNFYQDDDISINFKVIYNFENIEEIFRDSDELKKRYHDIKYFKDCFADLTSFNRESLSYDKYYNYLYVYNIQVNGVNEIEVQIASETELTQEKLDEITKLLMDNIVIINTEV